MDAILQPIRTQTLQQQVYQQLRQGLLKGQFAPGDSLTIRAVAKTLDVSEMPVREALQRLVSERALTQKPNRSIMVPILSREGHRELLFIRTKIEGLAASEAAERMALSELPSLDRLNEQMAVAYDAGDFGAWRDINHEFHFAVYRGSQLPRLVEIIDSLWLQFGPTLADAFKGGADPAPMVLRSRALHNDVVEAIRNRDKASARRAIVEDLMRFSEWYLRSSAAET